MESFGRYTVLRRLGQGGMAEVFLAREPLAGGLSKLLVIKKIHPQLAETPQFRQMFEDEAKVAVNLNHPNVVQTFGYGQIGPTFYIAMEHVEGVDLLRLLNATLERGERVPFGLSAYLGQQVAKGLDYAHRRTDEYGAALSIVHRDISPQNILVSWDGMVKIVDFGIARARHVKEVEGVVKGKFAYMSPEQASGQPVDARSDIFSMGIVLWELSTGRSMFGTMKGKHALQAIRAGQFQRPREVDPRIPLGFEDIILRCLAVRAEDRYQTARDLHRALGKFFFELSAKEGQIYESGAMAAFLARSVAREPLLSANDANVAAPEPAREPESRPRPTTDPAMLSTARPIVVIEGELSGMSALRRSVGDSRAREVLLDFLRVTEHVAYKHAAHADRIDERGFAYLIGLSGGSEEDPVRAIRLSLALIEALDGISRDLQPPLQIAIGIQRGSALVAPAAQGGPLQYQLIGHTTQVARELSREAMPGEILVGGGAYRAARSEYRFEEIEPIALPSDEEELEPDTRAHNQGRARVYRLLGMRARADRLAEPAAVRPIIGRSRELEHLQKALATALEQGRAQNVILLGEAGVGKSAIVDAFRRSLPADAHVLRAAARPSLRETPFALAADIGRDALAVSEDAEPREVKRMIEAGLDRLFADQDPRERRLVAEAFGLLLGVKVHGAEEVDPGERRHRLYTAMHQVQLRLAARRPLVVIVEDLHLADAQSFELFQSLLRESFDGPALGIATARPDERLEAWAHDATSTAIFVGELGLRERQELVHSRFADPTDAQTLTRQILDRAGGNPFFIHELLESLAERGVLVPDPINPTKLRWLRRDEALSVPTTVEAVVASRLDRLPLLELEVLRRAAVLGRVVRGDDVAALLPEAPAGEVATALGRLSARGILEQGSGDLLFRNLLTREVAYAGIAPELRARLHRAAADRIASSPRHRDDRRLADHLIAAGAHVEAGHALLGAAIFARDNASNADAFTLLTRALQLLPTDAYRARYEVHAEREPILRGWGKRPAQLREVHAMRRAATAAGDLRGQIEALCRLGMLYLDVGRHNAARRELDRALELGKKGALPLAESEALRLLATLHMSLGKNGEALELARQALGILDPPARVVPPTPPDRATLLGRAQALQVVGNIHVLTGRLREAVSTQAEALVIYRRLGARRLEAQTLSSMGWVLVGLGEFEEALVQYKRSLRLAQELGDRAGIGSKLASIGQAYADLGDLGRAHRYLDKALELHGALADQPGLCDATISLAQVHLKEQRYAEAISGFDVGLDLAVRTRNRYQEIRAMVYLAFAHLARGDDAARALSLAQGAVKLAREGEIANGEVYGLSAEAHAHLRAGDVPSARRAAEAAVALLDAGRDVDSPEEILFTFVEVAEAAGARTEADEALVRAVAEVRKKARRIRDETWRNRYLSADPAAKILARIGQRKAPV